MKQRCRRCAGTRAITVPFRDGSIRHAVCTVCNGRGIEWRKVHPPEPSRHFPPDTKMIEKETARMVKEADDDRWLRAIRSDIREDHHREISHDDPEHPNGPVEVP